MITWVCDCGVGGPFTIRLLDRLQKSVLWKPEFADFLAAEAGGAEAPNFGLKAAIIDYADVILHSAVSSSFKPDAGVYPVNIKAAENFGGILKNLRPSQGGFFVGTAAATMEPRGVITENMPFASYANDYIRSKRNAETLLRASNVPLVVLRPGYCALARYCRRKTSPQYALAHSRDG